MKSFHLLFIVFLLKGFDLQAQKKSLNNNTIQGIVIEKSRNEPVPFATIVLKGKENYVHAICDTAGKFLITIPDQYLTTGMTFKIDYVGLNPFTFTIKKKRLPVKHLVLKLEESKTLLKEVLE